MKVLSETSPEKDNGSLVINTSQGDSGSITTSISAADPYRQTVEKKLAKGLTGIN